MTYSPEIEHSMRMFHDSLSEKDRRRYAAIEAAYKDAMAKGKYHGHYAETNANEYWAEGTQWWIPGDVYHGKNLRPGTGRRGGATAVVPRS